MKRIAGLGAALTVCAILFAAAPATGQMKPSVRPVQPAVTSARPAVAPQIAPNAPAAPPPVTVQWGNPAPASPSVIDQIAQKYTLFLPDGSVRAGTEADLEKQRSSPEDDEDEEATP